MTSISPLNSVHLAGDHGNFKNKNADEIINIKEIKDIKIFQIVKFKKNKKNIENYKISGLNFSSFMPFLNKTLNCLCSSFNFSDSLTSNI